MKHGSQFLEDYWQECMTTILEIGSYDVNGSLRQSKPPKAIWTGLDFHAGPGVDLVVSPGEKLPIADKSFDLVLASSVFEHDLEFWKTIQELARVAKANGFIYINAPSNGPFHRFPVDGFRFYPDASIAFLKLIREFHPSAILIESSISEQSPGEPWNDFVAIYALDSANKMPKTRLSKTTGSKNIWLDGDFQEGTFQADTQDYEKHQAMQERNQQLENELSKIKSSMSWGITRPLRLAATFLHRQTFRKDK